MGCCRELGFKDTDFWWIEGGFFSFLFKVQQPCHSSLSAHVIPALVCGETGIYGQKASGASMAAVLLFIKESVNNSERKKVAVK